MQKFRIPQEVQREDRIFGPITMRRLIILTVGGGIVYIIYLGLKDLSWTIWGIPVFILSCFVLALAFIEPFGMRFEKFISRAIEFFSMPRVRMWDKRYSFDVFSEYIHSSHVKWEKKNASKEPKKDLVADKRQKQKTVSDFTHLLEKDISQINASEYNAKNTKPKI